MSDVIFAEGNEAAAKAEDALILDALNGPLKDLIDTTTDAHRDAAHYQRSLADATVFAKQWQAHVGGKVSANAVSADKVGRLATLANNIYDDASQGKTTPHDAQRAADLVATLDAM